MMRYVLVYFFDTQGKNYYFRAPLRFVFQKEKYTPYTELSLTVQDTAGKLKPDMLLNRVQLSAESCLLHDGIIDRLEFCQQNGVSVITVHSRGFTSLLLNNEMTPGIHTGMSLDKLMTEYYTFPQQIRWVPDSDTSNYIYVKPHRSMWDSVVNLAYKLYKTHPYIRRTNQICLQAHEDAQSHLFTPDEILSTGSRMVGSRMLSHLHMQDVEGNYNAYQLENPHAAQLHIVRHKQLAFDRQYLHDPEQSLNLTFALSAQGWRSRFVTCTGYRPLDVNDYVGAEGVFEPARISAVTVTGDASGLKSTYTVYQDAFSEA